MEIFQTIWTTLTTENEQLINILSVPLTIVELTITMLLFTALLDIKSSFKQKLCYVIASSLFSFINRAVVPDPYSIFINILFSIFLIMKVFKINLLKGIISQIFPFIIFVLTETILSKLFLNIFCIEYETLKSVPMYRISYALCVYLFVFIIFQIVKHIRISIKLLENMDRKSKLLLISNFIVLFISISVQLYLVTFYNNTLPIIITIFSIISLLTYFIISMYNLTRTTKLQITTQNLEEEKLYNKTLVTLHDNIRGFKHDFNNIVSAIGGYVVSEDMDGLKTYYSQLLDDCQKVNNLTILSPTVINNSAVYSLLSSKYYQATELGIKMNIEVFLDLNTLGMNVYEFTRIFGILLDNAIEAAGECDDKIINIVIRKDSGSNRQLCIVENTYKDKEVDTEKIFEKGYSSKNRNSGIGLWEVRQVLKRLNNVNLYTSKTDEMFKQQLEIYI